MERGKLMKVYERNKEPVYDRPGDMRIILAYLNGRGKILVSGAVIESLYREFSDKRYSVSWACITERALREFEEWLTTVER